MSSKNLKIRIRNAFNAMKAIGINETKVKPTLRTLLRVNEKNWEKNWELIEEENYRALADAIFENEKAEVNVLNNQLPFVNISDMLYFIMFLLSFDLEIRKYQDGQGSSAAAPNSSVPLLVLMDEPCELPESCGPPLNASQTVVESHQPVAEKNKRKQPTLDPSPLTDNVHLAITQISSTVVTMHRLIEQFDDQTKQLSDAEKELSASKEEALKALAAAEDRAKRAEEIARASMAAEKNALLQLEQDRIELHNSNVALTKMEKEKSAVEEQLKQVREALEQAHKLTIRL